MAESPRKVPSAPAASTAPVAPKAPDAPKAPEAAKAEKKPREKHQEIFESAEAATKAAGDRTKGPRRAFKVTDPDGETTFVVANNEQRAAGAAFLKMGGKVEELGGKARKSPTLGVDGALAIIQGLPEEQRKAILEQLSALSKK